MNKTFSNPAFRLELLNLTWINLHNRKNDPKYSHNAYMCTAMSRVLEKEYGKDHPLYIQWVHSDDFVLFPEINVLMPPENKWFAPMEWFDPSDYEIRLTLLQKAINTLQIEVNEHLQS